MRVIEVSEELVHLLNDHPASVVPRKRSAPRPMGQGVTVEILEISGAQGRSRTTDTTIFSRLLYH